MVVDDAPEVDDEAPYENEGLRVFSPRSLRSRKPKAYNILYERINEPTIVLEKEALASAVVRKYKDCQPAKNQR